MDSEQDERTPQEARSRRIRQWIELWSAVLLAAATVATAWSAYKSSLWGGEQAEHDSAAITAIVRSGEFNNLALQTTAVHVGLFSQWASAVSTQNTALADFLFARFPEPLKASATAWLATQPLTNPSTPMTPFDMPQYVLPTTGEAARWESSAIDETEAAGKADAISDRYLVFTIIFASVLFFGGISGKFGWQLIDVIVLVLGALVLFIGLVILFRTPIL